MEETRTVAPGDRVTLVLTSAGRTHEIPGVVEATNSGAVTVTLELGAPDAIELPSDFGRWELVFG